MSVVSTTGSRGRSWRSLLGIDDLEFLANLGLAAAFIGMMAVQLARHQMWRDETNAWGIVLASPTLPALFYNLHYEGHPGLWHLLLWCASWISPNPAMMKVVHGCVAVGFIVMIACRSPFSRFEKILLLLNFFVFYEYAIISRNYGIGLLLALVYVQVRLAAPDRLLRNAAVLGLLANTNVYAAVLSVALACEAALDRYVTWPDAWVTKVRRLMAPAAIYVGFVLVCALTIWPAPDISWRTTTQPLQHVFDPQRFAWVAIHYIDAGMVPLAAGLDLLVPPFGIMLGIVLLPIVGALTCWVFRNDWRALLVFGMTVVGAVLFGQFVYEGWERHWGITFAAFIVAYWMQQTRSSQRATFAVVLLWLGAVAGIGAYQQEVIQPLSNAGATARWLQGHDLQNAALVGTPDTSAAGVAELLGRPIYFLDCSCVDTFLRFQNRRDDYRIGQLPARLATAMAWAGNRPMVLMDSDPLSQLQVTAISAYHIQVEQIAAFTGAIAPQEDFYLYKVTR
jgi:hypothetical protein